jgi:hypothetical protein
MLKNINEKDKLQLTQFTEKEITPEVLSILKNNDFFSKSSVIGDPSVGLPIEYEKLIIQLERKEIILEYYNKIIHYMAQNNENARQIFQAFTYFMSKTR